MKHHQFLSLLLISLFALISLTNSYEVEHEPHVETTIDRRTHRHHNRNHKRMGHRKRGRRFTTTQAPFGQYDEDDYDYVSQRGPVVNITARVGGSVILPCSVNSSYGLNPGVIWMRGKMGSVLTYNQMTISADSRFSVIQTPLQQKNVRIQPGDSFRKRHNQKRFEMNHYHFKINSVQANDENEYACVLTQGHDDQSNLKNLVYLRVTQSPAFVETLTSPSNVVATQYSDVKLKCQAKGKPAPRINWYKIHETGYSTDLNHRSRELIIRNISKNDLSKYECVAENGILPSVSKKFSLTINYAPTVVSIKPVVYQNLGKDALIGCRVSSNPDSTIKWYRQIVSVDQPSRITNQRIDMNQYELIDPLFHTRYEILKFKQTNQTATYFKIKNIQKKDYTKFKCEATNAVGVNGAEITIQSMKVYQERRKNNLLLRNNNRDRENTNPRDFNTANSNHYGVDDDYLYDEDYVNDELIDNIPLHMIKSFSDHKNKTYFKYSINKSNRLLKKGDSLQRINENLNSGGSAIIKTFPTLAAAVASGTTYATFVLYLNHFLYPF